MKKMTTILGLVLISSTVFAAGAPKIESYDCGLQMGQSLSKLSSTAVAMDAKNLSEDLANYVEQSNLASKTRSKTEKTQLLQAAGSSWQSIVYSMQQIKSVAADEAAAINKACDLSLD